MFIQKGGDMTTITSHSLPLLPLRSNLGNLFGKRINDEPICPSSSLIRLGSSPKEDDDRQQQLSPQDCYGSENSQSNTICDIIDRRSMNGMDSRFAIGALTNDEAAISEPRSVNSASSYKADGGVHNNKDDDDEEMSYCSDDSELSVGKEVDDSVPASKSKALNFNDSKKTSIPFRIDDDSSTHERNERLAAALRYQPKLPNIIRPNPTRQEEFLRKSHFYAEEIMKHQINFMSVTKGLNISPKLSDNTFNYPVRPNALAPIHSAAISNPVKIELSRLQAFANDSDLSKKWSVIEDRSSCSPEATSFREIHSHLNAISKITSALGRDTCSRVQMTSPDSIASRESSQSPPTPHVQPFHHMLHNNFNESNLKFSIDNILKPSFGRRITDPLLKRNKAPRKNASQQRAAQLTASSGDGIAGRTPSIDSTAITAGNKTPALSPSDQTVTKLSMPSPNSASATGEQMDKTNSSTTSAKSNNNNGSMAWPAWVYCTRYSDRPSSGRSPRARRPKKAEKTTNDEKRPRTAFSGPQLARLKNEFAENRYLTERRRQQLSTELGLNEAQIKIWFQNKRAKIKKSSGQKNPLALQLMAQGLYNHSTVPLTREEEELQEMQERANAEAAAADDDDDDD